MSGHDGGSTDDEVEERDFDWKTASQNSTAEETSQTPSSAEESHTESLREENKTLRKDKKSLEETTDTQETRITELEETVAKLRQALSNEREEFKNYKDRAKKREKQAKETAVSEVIEDMSDVHNSLQRALDQDEAMDIREGVESTLRNFDTVLSEYDIELIDPDLGENPDATRHEVMMKDSFEDIESGRIANVFSVGYERDDRVLKPAKVVVSSGSN